MSRPKRTFYTAIGWFVWKLLALIGVPLAKKKLEEGRRARRR